MASSWAISRHFPVLDGIRGVAALLVVFRHTGAFFGTVEFQQSYLAVDVFFVLSGMVICGAYEKRFAEGLSATRFMVLRIIRICPLYYAGTVVGLFTVFVTRQAVSAKSLLFAFTLLPNIDHVVLFPLDGPAWTLSLEMLASIAYGVFGWRLTNAQLLKCIAVAASGLFACLVVLPEHTLDIGWSTRTWPGGFMRLGFSFTVGILLLRIFHAMHAGRESHRARHQNFLSWLVIGLVAAILISNPPASWRWLVDLGAVVVAFPALVFASAHLDPSGWSRRTFQLMGTLSFPLYVLHEPAGRLVQVCALSAGIQVEDHAPIAGFGLLAGLLILSFMLDRVFDRPIRAWLTALGHGAPGPLARRDLGGVAIDVTS